MFDEQIVFDTLCHMKLCAMWMNVVYIIAWIGFGFNMFALGILMLRDRVKGIK